VSKAWAKVKLGEVLTKSDEWIDLVADKTYREVTVRLWGKGIVQRREVTGSEIASSRRLAVRRNQFLISRIDARNGAIGIVPEDLDGAVVTNDFPAFFFDPKRVDPSYLNWVSKTGDFVELCKAASEGTTNRVRLKEERFLASEIHLPSLSEQRLIVARIEQLASKIEVAREMRRLQEQEIHQTLLGAFWCIAKNVSRVPMREIAPQVRRPVQVQLDSMYPELGIRSFGKGTFQKPTLSGAEIGEKRIFWIESGDLLFSNVFAWEGAIAVAKPVDHGRVGSHRYITCVPNEAVATASFLCFYFLTGEGMDLIRGASPGGAGRNRTLGLAALDSLLVPVPPISEQLWFDKLQSKVNKLRNIQDDISSEIDAFLPSVLDKAFKGEL
jgi:type I restriction enzyme, S subunit